MAEVTASMVKELREMTSAGMMDCKKALSATNGDMDKAIEYLREKGLAKAATKASRIAAEGICETIVSADGKNAAIVEVNSETDFVAKNEKFHGYVRNVVEQVLASDAKDIDEFLAETWKKDTTKTVAEELAAQIAVIGENMKIRRFAKLAAGNGFIETYIHSGGKIGVLIEMEASETTAGAKECARNIAMQVAAMNPKYIREEDVDADYLAHEKEIIRAQIMNDPKESQKPEKVIEGMIQGRVKKELKEICLLDQVYVKAEDGKQSVGQYVEQVAKAGGITLSVKNIVRFETGEGIEKKKEDFAAEVAKQMGQ